MGGDPVNVQLHALAVELHALGATSATVEGLGGGSFGVRVLLDPTGRDETRTAVVTYGDGFDDPDEADSVVVGFYGDDGCDLDGFDYAEFPAGSVAEVAAAVCAEFRRLGVVLP